MGIPYRFDPLGTLGSVQWYNWTAAVWTTTRGDTVYSSEYIISDYIPAAPGTMTFAGVGVYIGPGNGSVVLMMYKADGSYLNFYNLNGSVRTANMPAGTAYVRIQTTREKYKNAYIVQGGVYLFRGEDNPPKPL